MLEAVTYFASAEAAPQGGILGTLGIDVKLLIFQTIAFLLLLWLLAKFVFPKLGAMLEKREKLIEDSVKAAKEAEAAATKASDETAKLMKKARKDADEVVSSAKAEAAAMVEKAEKKSRERAEQIVADAEAEIKNDIEKARTVLKKETIELVAAATEKVVGKAVSADVDAQIIKSAVDEVEKS